MRDQIIVFGTNHERAPVAFRERLAISDAALPALLANRPAELHELAVLSTCNRTEFYVVASPDGRGQIALRRYVSETTGVPARDLDAVSYARSGRDAIVHLLRVAAGLDSMVLGEPHILGQIRGAFDTAKMLKAIGPILGRLGIEALRTGKRARTATGLARNRLSMPHAAVDLVADHGIDFRTSGAVVIGAGAMGALTAKVLRGAGIGDLVVVNRGEARGRTLAERVDGCFLPWSRLPTALARADVAFVASAAADFVLTQSMMAQAGSRSRSLTVVDLGVPRQVEPALRDEPGVRLLDVDDLERISIKRRRESAHDVSTAERLVEDAADDFVTWLAEREAVPTIAALRGRAEELRRAELERTLRKLSHLSERDRTLVAALSVGVVNKLLHEPVTRLRRDEGGESAAAARHLFALGME